LAYTLAQALLCESLWSRASLRALRRMQLVQDRRASDFRLLEPDAQSATAESTGETAEQGKAATKRRASSLRGQIRELADFVNLTTHRNGMRIILVHPAEAMNVHAPMRC